MVSTPTYDNLRDPEKRAVIEALLKEQGYLCCYCMSPLVEKSASLTIDFGVKNKISGIEHIQPQKEKPDLALDFMNFWAACRDCNNTRLHKTLLLTPHDKECEEEVEYRIMREDSTIPKFYVLVVGKTKRAEDTIEKLNLNRKDLKELRYQAIQIINEALEETIENLELWGDTSYEDKLKILLEDRIEKDKNGKYMPFCMVGIWYLGVK